MKNVLRLSGICKSYFSDNSVTQALHKVSLSFETGEFVAITGESGSGKSTLLNMIGGMDSFDDGEMYINGIPTSGFSEDEREEWRLKTIGFVFQDYSLIGHYSVRDNVIAALLLMGKNFEEASAASDDVLMKVGLSKLCDRKANELSSGQKQRLSIARALAKETGILVCDEPTGNLDSETGDSIMALLSELSKDSLVIMVTHNFAQAEPYVTRKVRLSDGTVISDSPVGKKPENEKETDVNAPEKGDDTDSHNVKMNDIKIISFFAVRNIKTQIGRSIMFFMFCFFVSFVSLVFFGILWQKKDDISTKRYDTKAFAKCSDRRITVARSDGNELTDSDMQKIMDLRFVESVDIKDLCNDINYYAKANEDYKITMGRGWGRNATGTVVSFLNDDHFMRSAYGISEEDLITGKLPNDYSEIVITSDDEKDVGKKMTIYFKSENLWGLDDYYYREFVVTGITGGENDQILFSEKFAGMIASAVQDYNFRILYDYNYRSLDYDQKPAMTLIVNEKLTGYDLYCSKNLTNGAPAKGEIPITFTCLDRFGVGVGNKEEFTGNVLQNSKDYSADFLEVSEELFLMYNDTSDYQASVYIDHYAHTDRVIKKLEKMGFKAISTIRAGSVSYDGELVKGRITIIGISLSALLLLFVSGILILKSLLKIKIKDFRILELLGMKHKVLYRISFYEMVFFAVSSVAASLIISAVISGVYDRIWNVLFVYIPISGYALYALYVFVLVAFGVISFNMSIKGKLNDQSR